MGIRSIGRRDWRGLTRRILLLCASSVVALSPLAAEKEIFVPANDVSFTISTDERYPAGEPIFIHYTIKNISNGPLYVPKGAWSARCPSPPHISAWTEDSSGAHELGGWGGSCASSFKPDKLAERMDKEAVLLKPGASVEGTHRLEFTGLRPGKYRIEASLTGWDESSFSEPELSELDHAALPYPLLRGTIPASTQVTLIPAH